MTPFCTTPSVSFNGSGEGVQFAINRTVFTEPYVVVCRKPSPIPERSGAKSNALLLDSQAERKPPAFASFPRGGRCCLWRSHR
jgi:hypothetical protein